MAEENREGKVAKLRELLSAADDTFSRFYLLWMLLVGLPEEEECSLGDYDDEDDVKRLVEAIHNISDSVVTSYSKKTGEYRATVMMNGFSGEATTIEGPDEALIGAALNCLLAEKEITVTLYGKSIYEWHEDAMRYAIEIAKLRDNYDSIVNTRDTIIARRDSAMSESKTWQEKYKDAIDVLAEYNKTDDKLVKYLDDIGEQLGNLSCAYDNVEQIIHKKQGKV